MKKLIQGKVIKKSGDKSYVLSVNYVQLIKKLQIKITRQTKIMFHSVEEIDIGSVVVAQQCAPLSKKKSYVFKSYVK